VVILSEARYSRDRARQIGEGSGAANRAAGPKRWARSEILNTGETTIRPRDGGPIAMGPPWGIHIWSTGFLLGRRTAERDQHGPMLCVGRQAVGLDDPSLGMRGDEGDLSAAVNSRPLPADVRQKTPNHKRVCAYSGARWRTYATPGRRGRPGGACLLALRLFTAVWDHLRMKQNILDHCCHRLPWSVSERGEGKTSEAYFEPFVERDSSAGTASGIIMGTS